MKKAIIIFGTGSMARVLYSFLKQERKEEVIAFCADDQFVDSPQFLGLPLFRYSQLLSMINTSEYKIIPAFGFHEMNKVRENRCEELSRKGFEFANYVHSSTVSHDEVYACNGIVIYDNVAIHTGVTIGAGVFISSNVSIGHDCDLGHYCWINSGVSLGGGVTIGDRCVLSMNACIAHGVKLGAGTFVGAGTLVTQNTEPNSVIVSRNSEIIPMDSERFLKVSRL